MQNKGRTVETAARVERALLAISRMGRTSQTLFHRRDADHRSITVILLSGRGERYAEKREMETDIGEQQMGALSEV